jgi:hypothetical protein
MIDFETLSTAPNTVVLSLGAVLFTREKIVDGVELVFDLEEQLRAKSDISGDTLVWWLKQGDAAKAIFERSLKTGMPMQTALKAITDLSGSATVKVWGNGASFDVAIIENLYRRARLPAPWKFWNHRCYRTLKAMHQIEAEAKKPGDMVKHNALDDAMFQANCLIKFLQKNPGLDR